MHNFTYAKESLENIIMKFSSYKASSLPLLQKLDLLNIYQINDLIQ